MADAATGRENFSDLRRSLPAHLPAYLGRQRWFGGKARTIRSVEVTDIVPMPVRGDAHGALLLIIAVAYGDGACESCAIPMLRAASSAELTTGNDALKGGS